MKKIILLLILVLSSVFLVAATRIYPSTIIMPRITNVTNTSAIYINGTDINDIYVNEDGDTMTGGLFIDGGNLTVRGNFTVVDGLYVTNNQVVINRLTGSSIFDWYGDADFTYGNITFRNNISVFNNIFLNNSLYFGDKFDDTYINQTDGYFQFWENGIKYNLTNFTQCSTDTSSFIKNDTDITVGSINASKITTNYLNVTGNFSAGDDGDGQFMKWDEPTNNLNINGTFNITNSGTQVYFSGGTLFIEG